MKKKGMTYLTTVSIGLVIVVMLAFGWGIDKVETPYECVRILADSFTIPGIIMASASVIIWISSKGGYDGLTYGFSYVKKMFTPSSKMNESLYDYKMRREEKRMKPKLDLLWVGLAFIAIAVIFTLVSKAFPAPPIE